MGDRRKQLEFGCNERRAGYTTIDLRSLHRTPDRRKDNEKRKEISCGIRIAGEILKRMPSLAGESHELLDGIRIGLRRRDAKT